MHRVHGESGACPPSLPTLLKMWGDDHTKNWCELIATGLTPDFSVIVTPSIMV